MRKTDCSLFIIPRRGILLFAAVCLLVSGWAGAIDAPEFKNCKLTVIDPMDFFVDSDQTATVSLSYGSGAAGMPYEIRDYSDAVVVSGEANPVDGAAKVTVQLPVGYYELAFPDLGQRFGIVSMAPQGDKKPDPFFCVMGALSLWCPDHYRSALVRMVRRAGISAARECLNWHSINPAPQEWQWNAVAPARSYDPMRNTYRQEGVPILEYLINPPAWIGSIGKYPLDLVSTTTSWNRIAERWSDNWIGLEIWNEPDIHYGGNMPADQYLPIVRAIAYNFSESRFPLGGGVFARSGSTAFIKLALENGLTRYCDFLSFHTYNSAVALEDEVRSIRDIVRETRSRSVPIWITESGWSCAAGQGRSSLKESSDAASEIAMKAIEAKACGVERYFAFMLPFYEERGSSYGMLGQECTPMRQMAAYTTAIGLLSHFEYAGDLEMPEALLKRARVFRKGDKAVVVLYSGSPGKNVSVPFPVLVDQVRGIDGRALAANSKNEIPVLDGISYAEVAWEKISKWTQPAAPGGEGNYAKIVAAVREKPSSFILQFIPDLSRLSASSEGYWVDEKSRKSFPVNLRITNLAGGGDPSPVAVVVATAGSGERRILARSKEVTIGANEAQEVRLNVDLGEVLRLFAEASVACILEEDGQAISSLELNLLDDPSMDAASAGFSNHVSLPIANRGRWTGNIVAGGKLVSSADKTIKFDAEFTQARNRWAFPIFVPPKDISLSGATGILLRARIEKPAAMSLFLWEINGKVGYVTPTNASIIPADGKWHTAWIPFSKLALSPVNNPDPDGKLDLEKVSGISVGFVSQEEKNSFEVGDIKVVWK